MRRLIAVEGDRSDNHCLVGYRARLVDFLFVAFNETERVADRVEVDAERRARLHSVFTRAVGKDEGLTFVEVVDDEVEVTLLRDWPIGPGWGDVPVHLLKGEGRLVTIIEFDPGGVTGEEISEGFDVEFEQPRIKVRERQGVWTVEGH